MRSLVHAFLLPATLLALLPVAAQTTQSCPPQRTISVSGSATVSVDADLAIVHVGYKVYAADAKSAYASATETSNAIMSALTGQGVAREAIESTNQALQHTPPYELQQYPANSADRQQREFQVTQEWTARVKPNQAASVLDAAIRAGANESGSIQWTVADPTAAEAQATARATANARTIAELIARTAGVKLGAVQTVTENQPTNPIASASMNGPLMRLRAADEQPLAINSRRIEFTASIYASFAIE